MSCDPEPRKGRYPREVSRSSLPPIPWTIGIHPFTRGDGWTVEGIERVMGVCRQAVQENRMLGSELPDIMVVVCPEISCDNLYTNDFRNAWQEFAARYQLQLVVNIRTTMDVRFPGATPARSDSEGDWSFVHQLFCRGGGYGSELTRVWFLTRELYELNRRSDWLYLLHDTLGLRIAEGEECDDMLDYIAENPERAFGLPGVICAPGDGEQYAVIIRANSDPEDLRPVGRIFRIPNMSEYPFS